MIYSTALVTASFALFSALQAAALKRDLHIVNAPIKPDGFPRVGTLAEGVFPGPILAANKGDNFQINVINELNNNTMLKSTSIHWHGLFQKHTNWADGPAFVNQCPIAANHSFLYNFDVPDQAGTFWYHSHLGLQYCDGLCGPIVIYDPYDPLKYLYDVDDETTVMTLSDWYHLLALELGRPPFADSTLINGLGRYAGSPPNTPLAVVNVKKGTRYRIRLVSMSCDSNYVFSIDGHTLTVIEADGIETQPLLVDSLQIYAAQRYSFILNANRAVGNYWIRANPDRAPSGFVGGINSAIIRYAGAPNAEPTTNTTTSVNPLVETNLHPLIPVVVPGGKGVGEVDYALNLLLSFNASNGRFSINNATFIPPTVPVLLQILSGAQTAQELLPPGSVYPLPANSSIEISIPSGVVGGAHPFHLHGHAFDVIRSANSSTYNYINPVRRDVVNIGIMNDNVTIRFQTDNPGPWFLHCHIDFHLDAGLAIVFAEDVADVAYSNPVPEAWRDLCPIYDSLTPDQL